VADRLLITGGSGFIGHHVVDLARAKGHSVVVIDHNPPLRNDVEFVQGPIEESSTWDKVDRPDEVDGMIHLAAKTSVLRSVEAPEETFASNVIGTDRALEFARVHGVPSFAAASTNAVVGNSEDENINDRTPLAPLTPYGATKAAGEMLASAYHHSYHIATAMIRLTNVYGPEMWAKDSVIPRLFRTAAGITPFSIYGDGEQIRDFVYVLDVAEAFLTLVERHITTVASFGAGRSVTINELVTMVESVTGKDLGATHVDPQPGEMRGVRVSLAEADRHGLHARTTLEDGLASTWRDFIAHH
jgi:UDP-glucose 4-epimerase